jgi:hypothetical protein
MAPIMMKEGNLRMTIHTGMRKAMAVAAATAGLALALQSAPAANARPACHHPVNDSNASDLSPSSQRAWSAFICGGGRFTGGMGRMVSGAWIGWPTIIVSATGGEITADQEEAWTNWDRGAYNAGRGAAMLVSGAYVGAPGIVLDQIKKGATPADLSARELEQVTFAIDPNSRFGQSIPGLPELPGLPSLPIDPMDVLDLLQGL